METTTITDYIIEPPNVEHLVTEDDTPVDNIFSEKQQRLLVDAMFSSHPFGNRPFVASANVGIYYGINKPFVVPDVFLSLDVSYPDNIWEKAHRVYMVWQLGKTPDVVIEIVSNTVGHEGGKKFDTYANMGIRYYVVFDPIRHINKEMLNVYELHVGEYYPKNNHFFEKLGIGLCIWNGLFEERTEDWLRWCDADGNVLLTGLEGKIMEQKRADREEYRADNAQKYAKIQEEYAEQEKQRAEQEKQRAEQEKQRAEQEKQRAEQEKLRAEQEKQRADKLAEKLRAMGINPDED